MPKKIIETNSPFELWPETPRQNIKYGALLIHGLFDSPFTMRDTGNYLQQQGLLVRAILLPGHGTVPADLLNVTYSDWLDAVKHGMASLLQEVDQVFLVGFSTGASLALYHTLTLPAEDNAHIAGLILLSPAFKIYSCFDFMSNWHYAISWLFKRAQWLCIQKENDFARYQSITFNSVYQVYSLLKKIKKIAKTNPLRHPLFIAASLDDRTVRTRASLNYFKQQSNPNNKYILYANKIMTPEDSRINIRNSCFPKKDILNLSHTALPISPTNSHYGESQTAKKNHTLFCSINKIDELFFRVLYCLKLTKFKRESVKFNADFDFLMGEVGEFVKK